MDWQKNILRTDEQIKDLLVNTKRIAVLGIKTEAQSNQPAYYVPQYMKSAGFEIVPVPVYYPEATEILGAPVYRTVSAVPGEIDLLNVFRRPSDIDAHVADIVAKKPRAVWFQSGIRNDAAARIFAENDIKVVQDLCLMVEHRAIR